MGQLMYRIYNWPHAIVPCKFKVPEFVKYNGHRSI
uniref:Uncharacterized protein n=1 Tax=Manihot esculenta TaxID=3983 RepID=A0A2C9WHX7_MANES